MTKEIKITFSIALTVIIAVILLMALSPKEQGQSSLVDESILVATTSHMTGLKNAKVTLVEFGDYQCPACAAINTSVKELIAGYAKNPDFNFVYRHFPLSQHKNAVIAAEAAEAAGAQGKFWEMSELLYKNQDEWAEEKSPIDIFMKYAEGLRLNKTQFKSDIESNKYEAKILADRADGNKANVSWTPTFYINGELQQSAGSLDEIKSKIDSLLKK